MKVADDVHAVAGEAVVLAAVFDHRFHGVEIGRPDHARGRAGLGNLPRAGEIGEIRHPGAVVLFRNEHGVEPERIDVAHIVPGEVAAAVVAGGARRDFVARQRPHAVEQHGFVVVELQRGVELVEYRH